jgi:hypothetical protein
MQSAAEVVGTWDSGWSRAPDAYSGRLPLAQGVELG